jgi:hypothetical protein
MASQAAVCWGWQPSYKSAVLVGGVIVMQDTLEPGKVTLAEQIIKAGLVQLPMSMFMIVFHSSFLIEVQSSYQSGYTALQVSADSNNIKLEVQPASISNAMLQALYSHCSAMRL